ncbi:MAG TPA: hypothetical protein VGQ25_05480 [Gemmatimonadales bacterium]|nr:hypothetical protein [Gemmatimonadales bacterium]
MRRSGVSLLLAACAPAPQPAAPPSANVVTITATDYAFAAPDTIPAGLTTFKMLNQGREPHQAVVMGASSKTWDEIRAAMIAPGPLAPWLSLPGGPGAVAGDDSSNATARLEPGNYFIVCFIPSPDGQPHVAKGMVRRLVVAPAPLSASPPPAEPHAEVVVTLSDYAFTLSTPLTAGTHTIRVENTGPQLHALSIERLAPGKTVADLQRWIAGGMKGEPPTRAVGGFEGPDVGKTGWFTVTLAPGKYVLSCYVPDAKDGQPHVMHGMVQEITVS